MKHKFYLLLLFACVLLDACKKESITNTQATSPMLNGLLSFSMSNQVMDCVINTYNSNTNNNISAVVADSTDYQHMTINFTLAPDAIATVNGAAISSGATVDMSKLFYLKISSADGTRSSMYLVALQKELSYWGVPGNLISAKSLTRNYNFYFDQFAGTTSDSVNCVLAASTMAIKWADSTFTKTVVDARSMYLPKGEWSDRNMSDYMTYYGISHEVDSVEDKTNIDSLIKTNIDNNRIMAFLTDMYYISSTPSTYQHVNSFWKEYAPGIGHCVVVKGYRQTDVGLFAEVYDPYSNHRVYVPSPTPSELIGKDRYYSSADLKTATAMYSTEVFVVAPKGEKVLHPIVVNLRIK